MAKKESLIDPKHLRTSDDEIAKNQLKRIRRFKINSISAGILIRPKLTVSSIFSSEQWQEYRHNTSSLKKDGTSNHESESTI